MARYRLTAPHFIDGAVRYAGEEIEFEQLPTPDMVPLDEAAYRILARMPWAGRGWRLPITAESLPGGRHADGSPVLLNRPVNFGAPLTRNPPQPRLDREIPFGTRAHNIRPFEPLERYWGSSRGSIQPGDALRPYDPEC